MGSLTSHLRLAVRSFARQPVLFAAVVMAVALALAANASLFAILDGLLFKPLPFRHAGALVHIELPTGARAALQSTPAEREALVQQLGDTPLFAERASAVPLPHLFEEGASTPSEWDLQPVQVSPAFFPMLGVQAAAGRVLIEEDEGRSSPRPIVIGHDVWRDRFGASRDVIGTTVRIEGTLFNRPLEIVGVMPEGFSFPAGANVWAVRAGPASPQPPAYARLAPGATIEQARAMFPGAAITPLREHLVPAGAGAFRFLLVATGLLLLVAWVQVAALLFSRTAGRAKEIGTQLALGASRRQLFAQSAAEGALVAAAALAAGWLMAGPLTAALVRMLPGEMTAGQALAADARVFAFTAMLSMAGLALLSVVPLQMIRRASPLALMRAGGSLDTPRSRGRIALLACQLAASAALLYVASLAVHSFVRVRALDLGFEPARVVAFRLPNPSVSTGPGLSPRDQINTWAMRMQGVLEATRAVPGVRDAATGSTYPLRPDLTSTNLVPAEHPDAEPMTVRLTYASSRYIEALGLRIADGRSFGDEDYTGGPTELTRTAPVALINETLARDLTRFGPIVGQRLQQRASVGANRVFEIVGIVRDAVDQVPGTPPEPRLYLPRRSLSYVIARLDEDPVLVLPRIRAAAGAAWDGLPPRGFVLLEDEVRRATADHRARSVLLAAISLLCLPIAAAGIVGAVNFAVRQRTREIAVRLALGADPFLIRRRILAATLATTAASLAVGTLAGILIGRAASRYLFGISAADAATVGAVWLLLIATAWLAALPPAARASRIDPVQALKD
jgi:putative ABC transport system permease protein